MLLNLKIILLTLRFEKCQYFARNNFLAVIREIFFAPANRYKDDIIHFCLDILHELLAVFKDPQLLNCYYYFDHVGKLFDLMMFCVDNDQQLITLLKILIHIWGRWYATRIAKQIQLNLRRRVFEHAVRLPLHRVQELRSGGVASILREDGGSVGELVFGMLFNPWRAIIQLAPSSSVQSTQARIARLPTS